MDSKVRSAYMDIVEQRELGENLYQVTIAANEGVRQPPDLDFSGLSTENYARNPVVMWAHDVVGRSPSGGLPVGRTLELTKGPDGRMVADFEFLSDDPFAQRVKNAWDKGFLQAASISWIPVENVPAEGGRWRDTRSDLLEWSIVAVPADPDALREAHRRMMQDFLIQGHTPTSSSASEDGSGSDGLLAGSQAATRVGQELRISPQRLDDLSNALALLGNVVGGLRPFQVGARPMTAGSSRAPDGSSEDDGPRAEDVETRPQDEMAEVGALVRALHEAVDET